MTGREKCRILKQIRAEIAAANDIALVIEECPHKGECKGTCPRCEAEVRYLERELAKREKRHKRVAVAGISAALTLTMAGCAAAADGEPEPPPSPVPVTEELTGDVIAPGSDLGDDLGGAVAPDDTTDPFDEGSAVITDGEIAPDDLFDDDGGLE
ncbi:MAG: hypothetical protein ACOX8R_06820 [Bacillota bacterium]